MKTPPYALDAAPGFWLNLTFKRLRARSLQRFRERGFAISPEQWAVMVRLWERDGLSQSELADATFRDKAAVTRMLDVLEREGFVRRAADPDDGRRHRVLLTKAGRALEAELVPVVREFVEEAFDGVTPEQRRALREILERVYLNLEE